jgi:hypothetical protein
MDSKDWFWLKAAAALFAVSGAVSWLHPPFGVPYLVTTILLLPLLLPFIFSGHVRRWGAALGGFGRLVLFAVLVLHITLMRSFLAPIVLAELGYVFG